MRGVQGTGDCLYTTLGEAECAERALHLAAAAQMNLGRRNPPMLDVSMDMIREWTYMTAVGVNKTGMDKRQLS